MKKLSKRLLGAMLAIIMVVSIMPNGVKKATATAASAQSTITTGSIITYGSYPQTKVTSSSLISALNAQTLHGDSTVTYGGSKYKRVYFTQYTPYYYGYPATAGYSYQDENGYYINTVYWFKFEPLQWRVLSNINGELFVMADKILDSKAYNQVQTNVTWETCTMRSWLNNDFYNTAFNSTERARIKTSTVVNANNPWYGTAGGNNTNDKLFFLSYAEAMNPAYGFSSSYSTYDTASRAQGTDFSKSNGLYVTTNSSYLGNSYWWLRSPGYYPNSAGLAYSDGNVYCCDNIVNTTHIGARPAFKINLTSDIFTSLTPSFAYDNQVYNDDLAQWTMNCCDKLNPPPRESNSVGYQAVKNFLTGTDKNSGYKDKDIDIDHTSNPNDSDGIGFVLAHKIVNSNENIFTVVIRGTENMQWSGDMNITGLTYDSAQRTHTSFAKAKEIVKAQLKSYMSPFSGKKTLIITGHSRGAAVANLLAKDMTDENYKVFAYTYATPNVSLDAAANYHNIYNFCFTDDFVTRSPLWGYGKYGITYWATAQKLYGQSSLFKKDMDSNELNDFDSWSTEAFVKYMKAINPNTWSYYNLPLPDLLPPYDLNIETTHLLLAYKISPLLYDNNWAKAAGAILSLGAVNNDTCIPIIFYFGYGYLGNVINSTHNPKTYRSAIIHDGFGANSGKGKFSPDAVSGAKKSAAVNAVSGADAANPNAAELQQLRAFAQQGSNLAALGWDLNDISTWTGITWSDAAENRVQTIDLGFKNLTGALNLSGFSGLQSLNCAGNQLTAIDFGGCSALTEADVSHNNLTGISLDDCALLEKLECSWNQIASLGIGSCAALKYLYCEYNNLSAVNVSNNTNLTEFYCGSNNLAQLDVTANTALNTLGCENNYLVIQDGSTMMTEIQNIMTRDSAWVSYSPQKVPQAAIFNASDIAELTAFANTDANKDKLGWDLAAPKDWACVEWVQKGTEYRVKELHIENLGLTGSMDLSGMTALTSLSCDKNALTGLNLNGCTSLKYLTCNNSQLQSLNITNCAAITSLSCENNYLNVSAGTALRTSIDTLAVGSSEFIVFEPQMIFAEVSAFNATEYNALLSFAQTGENLAKLGWDITKPGEWQGIKWGFVNSAYRVTGIDFSGIAVTGDLNISAFNLLTNINFSGSGITAISLPNNLQSIGDSAFGGCQNLTSIVIPNSVENIGNKAFYNCTALADVTIGEMVRTIGFGAFASCNSLTNIVVAASNMNFCIADGVLFNKAGTSLVYYPAGSMATEYAIPNNVLSIESGAFFGCNNLLSVVIGNGVTALSSESFSQCSSLEEVDISNSVVSVESNAFSYCQKLKNVYIPDSVTSIQANAFLGCSALEKVAIGKNTASIGVEAFSYYDDAYLPLPNLTVYCYEGSVAQTYATANGLNYFTYKIAAAPSSTAIINNKNNFIYGLAPGISSLADYINIASGYTMTYVPVQSGFGTGTIVNISDNAKSGTIVSSYTIIIFGDVNGDGNIDSMDAGTAVDIENEMYTWDPVSDAALYMAGDVNNDKNVDSIDAGIMVDFENNVTDINQKTDLAYSSKITFNSNGGNAITPLIGKVGSVVVAPANPTKLGYTFAGWVPALPATFPSAGVEVTAQWTQSNYTITFDATGGIGGTTPSIAYGTMPIAPTVTKEGYTFKEWSPAIVAVTGAATYTAQWMVNVISTITFDSAGGSAVAPLTGDIGSVVTAPVAPTKVGYTFNGWFPALPATFPDGGLDVTAVWKTNSYAITFDSAGGSVVETITQNYGTTIATPIPPIKAGYTFAGWLPTVPVTMPAANTNCVAQWIPIN